MIHLRLRTEYSFNTAFGPVPKVVQRIKQLNHKAAGIADRHGTWGHVQFYNECKAQGIKPILGVELAVVPDSKIRERQPPNYMAFLAKNNDGLREIYELVAQATGNFYYIPRLDYGIVAAVTDNVFVLSGTNPRLDLLQPKRNLTVELSYLTSREAERWAQQNNIVVTLTADNYYPLAEDKIIYEIMLHKDRNNYTFPMHIPDQNEIFNSIGVAFQAAMETDFIADQCNVELPQAVMVRFEKEETLEQICRRAISERCSSWNNDYEQRLLRELKLIKEKDYEDYFYVLWDAVKYARQQMVVGPGRGSSCGSLVCYLLGITEIDPIRFGLLFERFIDVTRKDLPDIDIDFADDKRELVFDYLKEKYGQDCVARLGTISRYKAKSAIAAVAKSTLVPEIDVAELKNRIIERNAGDARAKFCIKDTFDSMDIGHAVLGKYPHMRYAGDLEYHASHSGQHAAGIVVTQHPVTDYCSLDKRTGAVQVDKNDAEKLNLLKIDALGLRTLSILQDIIDQIRMTREELYRLSVDDPEAFKVLNDKRYAGIFQFEGYALQGLCNKVKVDDFEDFVSLTALARPGPLDSGSAMEFINRRTSGDPGEHFHEKYREYTRNTYGVIVYQEQIMQIVRDIGDMSWEDVSDIRKAMGKSLGQEYLNKYKLQFIKGAQTNGIEKNKAQTIWDHICTHGSYSFNRSHAVAYGLVSYWCCWLKAHYPLQFAVANLRNAKDDNSAIRLLREFSREGFEYVPVDGATSESNWSIQSGKLVGGLTGIKGCGKVKAANIIKKRKNGEAYTPGELKMLNSPVTPWDDIFECHTLWGHMRNDPSRFNIETKIMNIAEITDTTEGEFCIFGKIKEVHLRDMNESISLAKRGGRKIIGNNVWLNILVEDDTGSIRCRIDRYKYEQWGKPVIEIMEEDRDWLLIKGQVSKGFRLIVIEKYRHLTKVQNETQAVKKHVTSTEPAEEGLYAAANC